jgi:hypothetical protein
MIHYYPKRSVAIFLLLVSMAPASYAGRLDDTGITQCADFGDNNLTCPVKGFPRQDAQMGRDAKATKGTLMKTGGGRAGFDFTKLDAAGNSLPADAASWSCVRDNVTQLVWENKTNNGGLRDRDNTYSWYNPNSNTNGGGKGIQDGGVCQGSDCDTDAYAKAVNAAALCGFSNWRVPGIEELRSIVDYSAPASGPRIDSGYFANTLSFNFWSASPAAEDSNKAWYLYFGDSSPQSVEYKGHEYAVRLVRR